MIDKKATHLEWELIERRSEEEFAFSTSRVFCFGILFRGRKVDFISYARRDWVNVFAMTEKREAGNHRTVSIWYSMPFYRDARRRRRRRGEANGCS